MQPVIALILHKNDVLVSKGKYILRLAVELAPVSDQ